MRAITAGIAAAAVAAAGLIGFTSSASADDVTVSTSVASGALSGGGSAFAVTTSGACAGGSTHVQVSIAGSGFPQTGYNMTGRSTVGSVASGAGYVMPLLENLADAASAQNPAATLTGTYVLSVVCYSSGFAETGTTLGSVTIAITGANAWARAQSTSVSVAASPTMVLQGQTITTTATVTPSNAAGTVEFFATPRGGAVAVSLGSSTVTSGEASLDVTSLAAGDSAGRYRYYTISATFTPEAGSVFLGSSTGSSATVGVGSDPTAGSVTISPATGTKTTAVDFYSTVQCPNMNVAGGDNVQVIMTGPGFPEQGINVTGGGKAGNRANGSGMKIGFDGNMDDKAREQQPPVTLNGQYTFRWVCFGLSAAQPTAVIGEASMWFTTATDYQTTDPNDSGTQTTLEVAISPQAPIAGETVTYTATVSPSDAVGTVEFSAVPSSGTGTRIDLGAAEVLSGVATLTSSTLPGGSLPGLPKAYTVTAAFVPSSESFLESSATANLTVLAESAPVNTVVPELGNPRVGSSVSCGTGTWTGAQTFDLALLVGSSVVATRQNQSAGASVTHIPTAAQAGANMTCRVTAKASFGTTASVTTAAKRVALGPAPTVRTAPRITGTLAVGKTVSVSAGTWSPAGVTLSYQWVTISGTTLTPIPRATTNTLRIPATVRGKVLGVVVTAKLRGYADGTTTARASGSVR